MGILYIYIYIYIYICVYNMCIYNIHIYIYNIILYSYFMISLYSYLNVHCTVTIVKTTIFISDNNVDIITKI